MGGWAEEVREEEREGGWLEEAEAKEAREVSREEGGWVEEEEEESERLPPPPPPPSPCWEVEEEEREGAREDDLRGRWVGCWGGRVGERLMGGGRPAG